MLNIKQNSFERFLVSFYANILNTMDVPIEVIEDFCLDPDVKARHELIAEIKRLREYEIEQILAPVRKRIWEEFLATFPSVFINNNVNFR